MALNMWDVVVKCEPNDQYVVGFEAVKHPVIYDDRLLEIFDWKNELLASYHPDNWNSVTIINQRNTGVNHGDT